MSETRCSIRFQSTPASPNAHRTEYQSVKVTLSEIRPQRQGQRTDCLFARAEVPVRNMGLTELAYRTSASTDSQSPFRGFIFH